MDIFPEVFLFGCISTMWGGQTAVRILGFGSFLGNGLDSKTATKRFSLTANSFAEFFPVEP